LGGIGGLMCALRVAKRFIGEGGDPPSLRQAELRRDK